MDLRCQKRICKIEIIFYMTREKEKEKRMTAIFLCMPDIGVQRRGQVIILKSKNGKYKIDDYEYNDEYNAYRISMFRIDDQLYSILNNTRAENLALLNMNTNTTITIEYYCYQLMHWFLLPALTNERDLTYVNDELIRTDDCCYGLYFYRKPFMVESKVSYNVTGVGNIIEEDDQHCAGVYSSFDDSVLIYAEQSIKKLDLKAGRVIKEFDFDTNASVDIIYPGLLWHNLEGVVQIISMLGDNDITVGDFELDGKYMVIIEDPMKNGDIDNLAICLGKTFWFNMPAGICKIITQYCVLMYTDGREAIKKSVGKDIMGSVLL
jgi:hypothetical protein